MPVLLLDLPSEVLQSIFACIETEQVAAFGRVCRRAHQAAMPLVWRNVTLQDRTSDSKSPEVDTITALDHDDKPLIEILLTLASKPWLASLVQSLHYRCYLPPGPKHSDRTGAQCHPLSRTLSADIRTLHLVQLACANLINLHSLTIISGHHYLTQALLRSAFSKNVAVRPPIRALSLSHCSVSFDSAAFKQQLDFSRLHSISIFGTPVADVQLMDMGTSSLNSRLGVLVPARWGHRYSKVEHGGHKTTTKSCLDGEFRFIRLALSNYSGYAELDMKVPAMITVDNNTYSRLRKERPGVAHLILPVPESWKEHMRLVLASAFELSHNKITIDDFSWQTSPAEFFERSIVPQIYRSSVATVSSIHLDWALLHVHDAAGHSGRVGMFAISNLLVDFFSLDFPQLKSFRCQRPAGWSRTRSPNFYLLGKCLAPEMLNSRWGALRVPEDLCLGFLERHSQLQELGWAADMFFDQDHDPAVEARAQKAIEALSMRLQVLHVDQLSSSAKSKVLPRLRRFTEDFAAKLQALREVKISWDIPSLYMQEIVSALRMCPLQTVAADGYLWPGGFTPTWMQRGKTLRDATQPGFPPAYDPATVLNPTHEPEGYSYNMTAVLVANEHDPDNHPDRFWPFKFRQDVRQEALLQTMARYFRTTIESVDLIGFLGCPLLRDPDGVTDPFLAPLRHFSRLKKLVTSVSMATDFGSGAGSRFTTSERPLRRQGLPSGSERTTDVPDYFTRDISTFSDLMSGLLSDSYWKTHQALLEKVFDVNRTTWLTDWAADICALFSPHLNETAKQSEVKITAVLFTKHRSIGFDVTIGKCGTEDAVMDYAKPYEWTGMEFGDMHLRGLSDKWRMVNYNKNLDVGEGVIY